MRARSEKPKLLCFILNFGHSPITLACCTELISFYVVASLRNTDYSSRSLLFTNNASFFLRLCFLKRLRTLLTVCQWYIKTISCCWWSLVCCSNIIDVVLVAHHFIRIFRTFRRLVLVVIFYYMLLNFKLLLSSFVISFVGNWCWCFINLIT